MILLNLMNILFINLHIFTLIILSYTPLIPSQFSIPYFHPLINITFHFSLVITLFIIFIITIMFHIHSIIINYPLQII